MPFIISITMKNKKYQNNSYIHVAIVTHGSEFLNRKIWSEKLLTLEANKWRNHFSYCFHSSLLCSLCSSHTGFLASFLTCWELSLNIFLAVSSDKKTLLWDMTLSPNTSSCVQLTVKPNKLKGWSWEQRETHCRTIQGDGWLLPPKPQTPWRVSVKHLKKPGEGTMS